MNATKKIVKTPGVIGGKPRIDGTRIGVHNIVEYVVEDEYTAPEVAEKVYPHLTPDDVNSALDYYEANEDEMKKLIGDMRKREEALEGRLISSPDDLPTHLSNGA